MSAADKEGYSAGSANFVTDFHTPGREALTDVYRRWNHRAHCDHRARCHVRTAALTPASRPSRPVPAAGRFRQWTPRPRRGQRGWYCSGPRQLSPRNIAGAAQDPEFLVRADAEKRSSHPGARARGLSRGPGCRMSVRQWLRAGYEHHRLDDSQAGRTARPAHQ